MCAGTGAKKYFSFHNPLPFIVSYREVFGRNSLAIRTGGDRCGLFAGSRDQKGAADLSEKAAATVLEFLPVYPAPFAKEC